jgi:tetratricopeptide (TPR) repeat protein
MRKKYQVIIQLFIVALITIVAYFPSLKNDFTNWDDPNLILANAHIRSLSVDNLKDFFSTSYGGLGGYTPLVFLSYALDYHFFNLDSRAFHATNLFLHILVIWLVYAFVYLLSRQISISLVVAVLFSLHPLHVEAVAWAQGRKDLLYSLFYVAALICYLLFVQKKKNRVYYIMAFFLFILSLFSKVTAISFPLVILLLESHLSKKIDRSSLVRSIPFFIMSIVVLSLALITNKSAPSSASMQNVPYLQNLGLFFYAFVFYVSKAFLPVGLIARYSVDIGQYPWQMILNLAVFTVIAGLFYLAYKRKPNAVTFGLAFSILTLAPTLPFHFAGQPYTDRYMYLPLAGLLFILAMMFISPPAETPEEGSTKRFGVWLSLLLLAVLLGAQTWRLSGVWHDSLSLWTHVLGKDPRNAMAYLKRGEAFDAAGQTDKALADLDQAARLNARDPNVYNNRGAIYLRQAQYEKAMGDYDRALSLNPFSGIGYINRGILWGRLGQFEKALKDFSTALALDNESYLAYYYRGLAFQELKEVDPAIKDLEAAYRLNPTEQVRGQIELLKKMKTHLP